MKRNLAIIFELLTGWAFCLISFPAQFTARFPKIKTNKPEKARSKTINTIIQIFMSCYRLILPVKIIGNTEKLDTAVWKTDAFCGNHLAEFAVQ